MQTFRKRRAGLSATAGLSCDNKSRGHMDDKVIYIAYVAEKADELSSSDITLSVCSWSSSVLEDWSSSFSWLVTSLSSCWVWQQTSFFHRQTLQTNFSGVTQDGARSPRRTLGITEAEQFYPWHFAPLIVFLPCLGVILTCTSIRLYCFEAYLRILTRWLYANLL